MIISNYFKIFFFFFDQIYCPITLIISFDMLWLENCRTILRLPWMYHLDNPFIHCDCPNEIHRFSWIRSLIVFWFPIYFYSIFYFQNLLEEFNITLITFSQYSNFIRIFQISKVLTWSARLRNKFWAKVSTIVHLPNSYKSQEYPMQIDLNVSYKL